MAHETLSDLMLDELQDVYDAEHQLTNALPKMMEKASSQDLKQAFHYHLQQTEGQIIRLEQIFSLMGEEAKRKTCKAMKGLIAEGEDLMKDHHTSALLDAGLIGSAQRMEHYEIAAYGTLRAYAETLNKHHIATLLQQTLDEEKQTDEALTELSVPINQQSVHVSTESRNGNNKTLGGALGNVVGNIFGNGSGKDSAKENDNDFRNESHADTGNDLVTESDEDFRNYAGAVPMPGNIYGGVPANIVGIVHGTDLVTDPDKDFSNDADSEFSKDADKDFYNNFGKETDTNLNNDRDTNMSNDPASNFGNDFGNTSATDFDNAAVTDFHKDPATDFGNHTGDDFDAVYSNDADNDFSNDTDADFQKSNRSPSPKNSD